MLICGEIGWCMRRYGIVKASDLPRTISHQEKCSTPCKHSCPSFRISLAQFLKSGISPFEIAKKFAKADAEIHVILICSSEAACRQPRSSLARAKVFLYIERKIYIYMDI